MNRANAGAPPPEAVWIDPTAVLAGDVKRFPGVWIGPDVVIDAGCTIGPGAVIGYPGPDGAGGRTHLGANVWIGPNVHVEPGVEIGPDCRVGSQSVLRTGSRLGRGVHVGVRCSIMGNCAIGDYANLEAEAHVAEFSVLGENCQLMPGCVLVNDPYPPTALDVIGPTIGACAVVGAKSVIYPRVKLGYHALVGAMSIVKKDVEDFMLVNGVPARPICDVRLIRFKLGDRWVYPYPWMRTRMPSEDITLPAADPRELSRRIVPPT